MSISNYIKELTELNGISGFENSVSDYLLELFSSKFDEVYRDNMGNVIALKKSKSGNGKVMLEAHIDEIGFLVKSIDENGFLLVSPVGGIDPRIMLSSSVVVHGNAKYTGVVGAKPPHMMTSDEYSEVVGFDKMYIDVGMTYDEAIENIGIGAMVTFDSEYVNLKNNYLTSKCMDDRASLAVLIDCADKLKNIELGYNLYLCACVQEEVGLRGSLTAAYSVNPDIAIAMDVTHAKTPDESKVSIKCGSGPSLCVGPNIHPSLVDSFENAAKRIDISYEIEVEGGNTGTDAWSIQTSREGIPTLLISLPLKYMHTPIETLMLDDCEKTSEAMCEFLKSFDKTEDILC